MIGRLWRGWAVGANADAYEWLLLGTIIPEIASREILGYRGIEVFRREVGDETEFVTFMRFDSWEDVRAFAGDDPERAYVIPAARALLSRYEERSAHYELRGGHTP